MGGPRGPPSCWVRWMKTRNRLGTEVAGNRRFGQPAAKPKVIVIRGLGVIERPMALGITIRGGKVRSTKHAIVFSRMVNPHMN